MICSRGRLSGMKRPADWRGAGPDGPWAHFLRAPETARFHASPGSAGRGGCVLGRARQRRVGRGQRGRTPSRPSPAACGWSPAEQGLQGRRRGCSDPATPSSTASSFVRSWIPDLPRAPQNLGPPPARELPRPRVSARPASARGHGESWIWDSTHRPSGESRLRLSVFSSRMGSQTSPKEPPGPAGVRPAGEGRGLARASRTRCLAPHGPGLGSASTPH